ncbi:sigma-70 family RNA polymerase sigma factor [Anaerolineae bacterium CFX7]|nr:sigma-70 family RNA polymerase sigma factor [Anaerolineae bacterium CFX7]
MRETLTFAAPRLAWRASLARRMDALNKLADAELVARTLQGNRDAFGEMVRRHQTFAYNVALRVVGNRADALDVTQDAFVRAYDALASFDATRPFAPWLSAIVTNLALNFVQRKRPALELQAELRAPSRADPAQRALDSEQQARVRAALHELSPQWRAVIELRHFQEMSYDEIAAALELPISDVKSHLFRARQKLKQLLEASE